MNRKLVFIFGAAMCVLLSAHQFLARVARTSFNFQPSYQSPNYKVDFLKLALFWGPGFCLTSPGECSKASSRRFTIHGLWPTESGTYGPNDCDEYESYDESKIADIMHELDRHWFNQLKSRTDTGFRSYEWRKHGTCARGIPGLGNQADYFAKALELARNLPILQTLAKDGIEPDDRTPYSTDRFQRALEKMTRGKTVEIDCDLDLSQPAPVVTGIKVCFDKSFNFQDCPSRGSRCGNRLILLASLPSPTIREVY